MPRNSSSLTDVTFSEPFSACVACGSGKIYLWRTKSVAYTTDLPRASYHIFRCKACGTGFLNPPPSKAFLMEVYSRSGHALTEPISLAEVLEKERRFPNSTLDAQRMSREANLRNRSGVRRVLDVGSGFGFFSKAFREMGYEVVSINPGKFENKVFKDLNSYLPIEVTFEEYYDSKQFGIVLMSQVLEHIVDPASTIAKVTRHMAQGGVFCCAVPNIQSFSVRIFGTHDNSCLWVPEHVNYFTSRGLRSLLRRSGLEIINTNQVTRVPYDALARRIPWFPFPQLLSLVVEYGQRPIAGLVNWIGAGLYMNVYATRLH